MNTVRDIVSKVRAMFKLVSKDDVISDRAIAAEVRDTSYMLIKRETDKRKLFASPNLFTEIPCVEMVEVPLTDCCSYTSPCMIAASKYPIPRIAENMYGLLIQGVYSIDRRMKFVYTTPSAYMNYLALDVKKKTDFFWVYNNHLYITNPDIQLVTLSAFFEEDVDWSLYSCSDTSTCPPNPLDLPFKCPGYLQSDVSNLTYQSLLRTYKQSKEDVVSDDNNQYK